MDDVILDAGQIPGGASLYDVHPPVCLTNSQSGLPMTSGPGKRTPKVQRSSPSPASTPTPSNSGVRSQEKSRNGLTSPNGDSKRRRFTSSPVRPWKSPSPQPMANELHHSLQHHSMGSPCGGGNSSSASSLLRHISVIRETPPVLKPQVVAPSYHHQIPAHHHPHVPTHHHYHLVDPYAAAYHLYKNGAPVPSNPMTGGTPAITGSSPAATAAAAGHPHHWGAYN